MIYLERILVTQFYLYEAQAVELGEITAMFGPNGSGKSSFLDAVQIAMTGGNKNYIALNAQADDDKKKGAARTIRSYCLGQYGESADQRARTDATTYITLIWRDSDNGEPISVGISIYAHEDRDREEIRGRYVVPSIELTLGDHLESTDRGTVPRSWESFKHQLRERTQRVKGPGYDPIYNDADRFVRAMLLALRGTGGVPDSNLFLRAFRFALRMKFDKSVDSIVREDVLEANDTKIDKFKEVTESFRRLKEMVDKTEEKIQDGEKVIGEYAKASKESHRAAVWKSFAAEVNVEIAAGKLEERVMVKDAAEAALQKCQEVQEHIDGEIATSQGALRGVKARREGHYAHKDFAALQAAVQSESAKAREKAGSLASHMALVRRTLKSAAESTFLADHRKDLLGAAAAVEELEGSFQTIDLDRLGAGLRLALKVGKAAFNTTLKHGMDLEFELREAKASLKNANEELARAKLGKASLLENVQRLKRALEDHGLHPLPVCDVVRIVDGYKAWQPAIEAYLSANRVQALLIPDGEEREAYRLYRSMSIYGVKLAMESRQQIGRIVEPGSVAELLESDHPAALAYLQRQFRDVQRADSDSEALAGRRTLTVDGMLVSGDEIERLKLPSPTQCRIGIESREHLTGAIDQLDACKTELARLEGAEKQLQALRETLLTLPNDENALRYLASFFTDMKEAQSSADAAMRQMQSAGNEEYVALVNEESALDGKIALLLRDRDDAIIATTNAGNYLNGRVAEEREAQAHLLSLREAAKEAQGLVGDDREFERRQWDALLEKFGTCYGNALTHCKNQEELSQKRKDAAINAGTRALGTFQEKHRESFETEIAEDWQKAHAWISALVDRLRSTLLVDYKAEMEQAYRTSQETFKNDVALALKERLDILRHRIQDLNSVLQKCPTFSNGERYRFSAVVRKPLERLWAFVNDVAAHGPDGDLFGSPGNLPAEFEELLKEKAIAGSGNKSPLEDYREFYEFDVEILREDPITKKSKVIGHLSKRIGPGSGGEHRAPLYVIGGAALASAYRLSSSNTNGIRLMVIDEVFNKMDPTNITATMRYLEDLGLQLFMASPGENQGTLNAFLHRYYDVIRDVENNSVMLEGRSLSDEIREIHRADLPEFNPALIDEEIELLRRERAEA